MSLPSILRDRLRLPVVAAPMFIVSGPELVAAQCKAGIVGSFPALNARPAAQLDEWLGALTAELAAHDRDRPDRPAAPFAVNLIVHKSNPRVEEDLAACARHRVPIVITSLGAREDVNAAVRGWGGIVLHDVINLTHARKAIEKGATGLVAVAAGAGGHAGTLSPFALIQEIRAFHDGPLLLSGAIATGGAILAAQAMGADLAYVGSAFIVAAEARAAEGYKRMLVEGTAEDVVYTDYFSGVRGGYLAASVRAAGFDPAALPERTREMDFASVLGEGGPGQAPGAPAKPKAWRDVWSAGQGIGAVREVAPAAAIVARLAAEYEAARARLAPREGLVPIGAAVEHPVALPA